MALFGGKRKNNEAFKKQLEREALDKMQGGYDDNDYTLPYDINSSSTFGEIKIKIKAPGAITPEELMGKSAPKSVSEFNVETKADKIDSISMSGSKSPSSTDFLYQRMTESRKQNLSKNTLSPDKVKEELPTPQVAPKTATTTPKKSEPFDLQKAIDELKFNAFAESEPKKTTSELDAKQLKSEVVSFEGDNKKSNEALKEKAENTDSKEEIITKDNSAKTIPTEEKTANPTLDKIVTENAAQRRTSLLARCNAYLEDDEFGLPKSDPEKYRLESVENILQNFEERATKRALKNHAAAMGVKAEDIKVSTDNLSEPFKEGSIFDENTKTENSVITESRDISSSSTPKNNEDNVKHYFVADNKKTAPSAKRADSITGATIVLDSAKIGLTPPATANATQIFTTVSSARDNTINTEKEFTTAEQNDDNDELFTEYNNLADKMEILDSLNASKRHLSVRIITTLILLLISLLVTFPFAQSIKSIGSELFYGINLSISIAALCLNLNIIKSLPALFKAQPDTDLPSAIGAVTATLQSAVCLFVAGDTLPLTSVALVSLLFTNIAKHSHYSLIGKNFELIASGSRKKAVSVVTNKAATRAMVGGAISGPSLICAETETTNIKDFFKYSYCSDPTAKRIQSISLIGAIVGLGLGIAAAILNSLNVVLGITVFTSVTLVAAAPATLFISHLPFKAAAGRLSYYGAMLTGYRSANELEHCNAITVNCNELFPEGTIRLIDMKLLSPNPIDQSLLDAEALANYIGSPLAGMFKQITNTVSTTKGLKVDSVVYEEKMGISGWVNDRRVFVGNRVLLEGHGFTNLPPAQLDKKIMRKGYFPLYIVSDNVPCAMLVIKYTPDEEIAYELRRLCNTGTTVLVNNCDPNISAGMLCDYFGVYEETISIMSKQGAEQHKIVSSYKEDKSAGAAYTEGICGMLSIMTASINIKNSIGAMSVLYIICTVLGIAAIGVLAFTGLLSYITTLPILIFQLSATLITFLPPLLRRP